MRQHAYLLHTIRANKKVLKGGEKKAFFTRGNSTCRVHIHQHYEIYKERCKEGNIPENHHALPRQLYQQMKIDKKATGAQLTLDGVLEKREEEKIYTRDGATHAVAQFVACNDQVCAMVVWCIEADIVQPGSCSCRKADISKLPCSNEAQDNTKGLT